MSLCRYAARPDLFLRFPTQAPSSRSVLAYLIIISEPDRESNRSCSSGALALAWCDISTKVSVRSPVIGISMGSRWKHTHMYLILPPCDGDGIKKSDRGIGQGYMMGKCTMAHNTQQTERVAMSLCLEQNLKSRMQTDTFFSRPKYLPHSKMLGGKRGGCAV